MFQTLDCSFVNIFVEKARQKGGSGIKREDQKQSMQYRRLWSAGNVYKPQKERAGPSFRVNPLNATASVGRYWHCLCSDTAGPSSIPASHDVKNISVHPAFPVLGRCGCLSSLVFFLAGTAPLLTAKFTSASTLTPTQIMQKAICSPQTLFNNLSRTEFGSQGDSIIQQRFTKDCYEQSGPSRIPFMRPGLTYYPR
ncbi:hypothetical protein CEUSTIGMA_g532.t1 [Chlamydomonas eustigma]|uniref:Uncharacterized protein n=1 Tax=Chlamydomonas eustigma TaxID=1157962 RepID=A0A250WQV8_9CHLO|nr:hypothetical protein CEUSTIGMA_g532.t1 [Chlamydomonas eustigma]|eukprot:GAX73079.1 hypothetical protein CEUSTIGMA_g532.t1 [Chlamydomonas eustigma]